MKWFFTINEEGLEFDRYAEMIRVAVETAQRWTRLEPYCLYDGADNPLTAWLRRQGVAIVPCRSFLYDDLKELARRRNNDNLLRIGAGTFLRLDIANLAPRLGIDDEFVLYTDCDIMFQTDVGEELSRMRPRWFAAVRENLDQVDSINAGVMLLNLPALRGVDAQFKAFTRRHLSALVLGRGWDQDAFRRFFVRGPKAVGDGWWARLLRTMSEPLWDSLPREFNWRPYWGDSSKARIIHFHGPKPHQLPDLFASVPPTQLQPILNLIGGDYVALANRWERLLQAAAR